MASDYLVILLRKRAVFGCATVALERHFDIVGTGYGANRSSKHGTLVVD